MDRLAKLIEAYNLGDITLDRLEQELNFHNWQEQAEQGRRQHSLLNIIRNNMYNSFDTLSTKTPEEIVLEMERQKEICESLNAIHEIIGDRDFRMLICYIAERMSHKAIANKNNLARSTVTTVFGNIPKRVKKYAEKYPAYSGVLSKENLLPEQSRLEACSPSVNGYPYEFLQHISVPGKWGVSSGRRRFKPKDTCLLPEYFEKAFGDKETICTLCDNCRRKTK